MAITNSAAAAPSLSNAQLSVAAFDNLIRSHGMPAQLRQARKCPCWRLDSGQADPACTLCRPYGVLWDDPIDTIVLSTNRRPRRQQADDGTFEAGDTPFTFLSGVVPTVMARLTLSSAELLVDDLLTKGKEDTIRYSTVLGVERADYTVRNPPTGEPYENQLVSLRIEGITASPDIRVTGREVTWLNGAIADGTRYVIRFRTHPEFALWEVRERHEGTTKLPYVATAKRIEYLIHPRGETKAVQSA